MYHEYSACVGYWRCGAPLEQICVIMGIAFWKIEKIIEDYKTNTIVIGSGH